MPIIIDQQSPVSAYVAGGVPVLEVERARRQDAAPLSILVINLARPVVESETHILRLLANYPLQVGVTLTRADGAVEDRHLLSHYHPWAEAQANAYAGAVLVADESVDDAASPTAVFAATALAWLRERRLPVLLLGSGAALALARHHHVAAQRTPGLTAGVVPHRVLDPEHRLLSGIDPDLDLPVTRDWRITRGQLPPGRRLNPLIESPDLGLHLVHEPEARWLYVLDHVERNAGGVARVLRRRQPVSAGRTNPEWEGDDRRRVPPATWTAYAHHLVSRWLTLEVYLPSSLPA